MLFFHGTSIEKIKAEGILYGRRYVLNNDGSIKKEVDRCTYLTPDLEEAKHYGEVVLQVEYDPYSSKHNNYNPDSWQMRVYEPITIDKIRKL